MEEQELIRQVDRWAAAHREEFVRDLISLVNIPSVSVEKPDRESPYPFGPETARCAEQALAIGERLGVPGENDGYYTVSFLRRGETEEELGFLSHLDVVPAGDFWTYAPFQAVEKDGHVIGRGASDNKGPCLLDLYLLRCLQDLQVPLHHTVRVILGCNEESGMADVAHYLEGHNPPRFTIVSDCSFGACIGEKGILSACLARDVQDSNLLDFQGGEACNSVPDHADAVLAGVPLEELQKAAGKAQGIRVQEDPQGIRILAEGIAGHAAFPEGSVSAIVRLASFLAEGQWVSGAGGQAVSFLAEAFSGYYGEGLNLAFSDAVSGKTTCIGGKIRMRGGKLFQHINVRYAIETDQEEMIRRLRERCQAHGFQVEELENNPPRYISPDAPEIRLLMEVCGEYAGKEFQTFVMGGGTHARKFPRAVPFGPGKRFGRTKFGRPHAADEAVDVDELLSSLKVYVAALLRLDAYLTAGGPVGEEEKQHG